MAPILGCMRRRQEKNRAYLPAGLLALVLALGSCARQPVQVGFIGPMTGPIANIGVEGYRGFGLAVAEANEAGGVRGRRIAVTMIDDHANADDCLAAARQLVDAGVHLIVLHTISGAASKALPWLLTQDALVLSRTVSDASWAGKDDAFLRFVGSVKDYGHTLGSFAATKGTRSVAVVADLRNKAYAETMRDNFLSGASIGTSAERWVDAGFSHDAAAAWVVSLDPDAVLAVLSGLDAAKLAQALDKMEFKGLLYLAPWAQDQNLLSYSGRLSDRIYLSSEFNPDSTAATYLAFKARFKTLFSIDPVMSSSFGYEVATFLLRGIEDARSARPKDVRATLLSKGRFNGLQYDFELDQDGDASLSANTLTIKAGAFVEVR